MYACIRRRGVGEAMFTPIVYQQKKKSFRFRTRVISFVCALYLRRGIMYIWYE